MQGVCGFSPSDRVTLGAFFLFFFFPVRFHCFLCSIRSCHCGDTVDTRGGLITDCGHLVCAPCVARNGGSVRTCPACAVACDTLDLASVGIAHM